MAISCVVAVVEMPLPTLLCAVVRVGPVVPVPGNSINTSRMQFCAPWIARAISSLPSWPKNPPKIRTPLMTALEVSMIDTPVPEFANVAQLVQAPSVTEDGPLAAWAKNPELAFCCERQLFRYH